MLILSSLALLLQAAQPPAAVLHTLRTRFPGAEIQKWSTTTEDGVLLYDIEFLQGTRKLEADIRADGSVHNWEREVALRDLPAAVRQTIDSKFPGATVGTVLAITVARDSKEELQGYEVLVETKDGQEVEITVAPDGKVLEQKGANAP
jgi:uncharacterized membrane protein YkoI